MALHNGTVLVGAYGNDLKGSFSGSAWVYGYTTTTTTTTDANGTTAEKEGTVWGAVQRLLPSDLQSFSLFGGSVALCDGVAVVGAHGDTVNSRPYAGSVYIFESSAQGSGETQGHVQEKTQSQTQSSQTQSSHTQSQTQTQTQTVVWTQVAKLTRPSGRAHDHFGCAVAVQRGVLAVSSQVGGWTSSSSSSSSTSSSSTSTSSSTSSSTGVIAIAIAIAAGIAIAISIADSSTTIVSTCLVLLLLVLLLLLLFISIPIKFILS
jgi:hypothetical protein